MPGPVLRYIVVCASMVFPANLLSSLSRTIECDIGPCCPVRRDVRWWPFTQTQTQRLSLVYPAAFQVPRDARSRNRATSRPQRGSFYASCCVPVKSLGSSFTPKRSAAVSSCDAVATICTGKPFGDHGTAHRSTGAHPDDSRILLWLHTVDCYVDLFT